MTKIENGLGKCQRHYFGAKLDTKMTNMTDFVSEDDLNTYIGNLMSALADKLGAS